MSEESTKKVTKKHRKSEREEKGLKVKKGRRSDPGTAESGHYLCEGHQGFDRAEDQLSSSRTLPNTPPNTLSKVKASRKRKRADRDAMRDGSVNFETHTTEPEPQRDKKRDKGQEEDRMVSDIEI